MRSQARIWLVLGAVVAALTPRAFSASMSSPRESVATYRIVVHPHSPATNIDRRFVEDAFLKKIKIWPGGEIIRPVDLDASSPVRARFTEEVLRRPLAALRAHWQQRIFSGRDVPPPALATDADVIKYVTTYAGAIGYVSAGAAVGGARVVMSR